MSKENSILFLGDVVPYKPFRFRNHYKTVFNLECPITRQGKPEQGKIILNVNENHLRGIFQDNLLCLSLGNNHILDYGKKGLESTLEELEKLKTKSFGLELPSGVKSDPLIIDLNEIRIAFFSAVCPSTSPIIELEDQFYLNLLDIDKLTMKIAEIRKLVRRVVVYIHWGIEESSYPAKEDILIARKLIESGADIIIGSHAHAPQPIEKYKNGIIAYNLGNFIMPEFKKIPTYFNEKGIPQSYYTKKLMIWNRVSWGLIIDMDNLSFKVKRYFSFFDKIILMPVSPLEKYILLKKDPFDISYEDHLKRHLKKREFSRKIIEFLYNPHIPERLMKHL